MEEEGWECSIGGVVTASFVNFSLLALMFDLSLFLVVGIRSPGSVKGRRNGQIWHCSFQEAQKHVSKRKLAHVHIVRAH